MSVKVIMTTPWANTEVCGNCGYVNDYFFEAPPELCDFLTGRPLHRNVLWRTRYDPCPNCGKAAGKERVVRAVYVSKVGRRKFLFWGERKVERYFEEMTNDGPVVLPRGPWKRSDESTAAR